MNVKVDVGCTVLVAEDVGKGARIWRGCDRVWGGVWIGWDKARGVGKGVGKGRGSIWEWCGKVSGKMKGDQVRNGVGVVERKSGCWLR